MGLFPQGGSYALEGEKQNGSKVMGICTIIVSIRINKVKNHRHRRFYMKNLLLSNILSLVTLKG